MISNKRIAVIGLGYVGLPLARLFATKYPVVGFDINQSRINGLPVRIVLWKFRMKYCKQYFYKTHVAMAFPKFKKELTNNQINGLYCSAALLTILRTAIIISLLFPLS
jgi:UDP-N-acetyl-D-galactosamine dehydrogenase